MTKFCNNNYLTAENGKSNDKQGRRNGFQNGGAMEHKKNCWVVDALEWLKQKHFDLGDSRLIVSALKLFFSFVSLFFLLHKKVCVPHPGVASPDKMIKTTFQFQFVLF